MPGTLNREATLKKYMKYQFLLCLTLITGLNAKNNEILRIIEQQNIEVVDFIFTDLEGEIRSISLPADRVESALENGLKFDGSSIPGNTTISMSDMHLQPDFRTFRPLPDSLYVEKSALIFCDIFEDEETPYAASPRVLLKTLKDELALEDTQLITGVELEFFIFDSNGCPLDDAKYCDPLGYQEDQLKYDIMKALKEANIPFEKFHHEVAGGQYEVVLKYGDALDIADNIVLTKHFIKRTAAARGLKASFVPKPISDVNGSGMHIHYSVINPKTKINLFHDPKGEHYLSDFARSFVSGNIVMAKEFSSWINGSHNSFQRLVPGFEAPIFICWGKQNRSAFIRIPQVNENNAQYGARVEMRAPDPSCNPYLAFSAIAISGVYGVGHQLNVEEMNDNLYDIDMAFIEEKGIETLPSSMEEALENLRGGEFQTLVSEHLIDEYEKIKSNN